VYGGRIKLGANSLALDRMTCYGVYSFVTYRKNDMTEATKNVNYTPELTATIVEAYTACDSDESRAACLETLSAEHGKGVKSLRQKLVREGVYVKKAYVSKAGEKTETKDFIVKAIASAMGVTEAQLNGLEKATKPALTLIRATVEIAAANAAEGEES
jgi:hypothetical protein